MIPLLLNLLKTLAFLLLFTSCIYGYGNSLLFLLAIKNPSGMEKFLYSSALGMGILAHLVLGLGLNRLLYPPVLWVLLLIGCALCLYSLGYQRIRNWFLTLDRKRIFAVAKTFSWLQAGLMLLLLVNLIYPLFANALVPPTASDAVAYHLAAAKMYAQSHSVGYISFIPYTNWPFETEMLFTLCLVLFSDIEAQLITWLCLALLCLAIWFWGNRWFGSPVGLIAAVLFSATPMVFTLAGTGFIELPLSLFSFLAVASLIEWVRAQNSKDWLLSALFGGFAASTKLNGALLPLLLGLLFGLVMWWEKKTKPRQIVTRFAVYGVSAFLVVSFWYMKAWQQTGDPLWPFLANIFPTRNWDALGTQYLLSFIQLPNLPLTFQNWLLGFWKLTSHPALFGPPLIELGWSYLLFLPLALPALLTDKTESRKVFRWLSFTGIVLYTSWFFQTHQTRFLMPAAPVFALLAANSINWLVNIPIRYWKPLGCCALFLYFLASGWFFNPTAQKKFLNNRAFLTGHQTREEYLENNSSGYDAYQYANKNLPPDAYVWLALYEVRGYYLDRNYMWANPISQRDLKLEQYSGSGDLVRELQRRGITHILFSPSRINRYLYIQYGPQVTGLAQETIARYGRLIYTSADKDLELYEFHP